ncbi:hypothetical protein ARSEF4850_001290 [Beauveria asiatica]
MAARQLPRYAGPQPQDQELHGARRVVDKICLQLLLHGADPHERDDADQDAYDYAGDTAGDGESSLQATVMVEGDTPSDVESV